MPGRIPVDPREQQLVIPEAIACGLIEDAERLAHKVTSRLSTLLDNRERLRKKMADMGIVQNLDDIPRIDPIAVHAIDGGCGTEDDLSSVIFSAIAVRIALEQKDVTSSQCVGCIPHLSISSQFTQGMMLMFQ
jgi:hypothetical protein